LALLGDTHNALDEGTGERAGEKSVGEGWGEGAEAGEFVGKAKDVVVERVEAVLVVLGEELGLPGGDVYLHWALGLAGLATEAKVESLIDGLALEALFAQCSGEHLPEEAGAAAGGVLLVTGGTVAGTHDTADGVAACADADTALGGARKGALVGGEGEVGFELTGGDIFVGAET